MRSGPFDGCVRMHDELVCQCAVRARGWIPAAGADAAVVEQIPSLLNAACVVLHDAAACFRACREYAAACRDATAAMVDAINTHTIVMFGETHANKQEYAWLCSLVRDPAFHARVDDIVVEFGNSLYQKSVDRWIAGEDVPMAQVEKAWRNVVGAVGPVSPVYAEFYEAVRESNRMPGSHKVRLLLGDPYADWEKIKDAEDLGPFVAHRDEWYAQVVKDEVLAKGHRALLIMGAGHFRRANGPGLIEQKLRAFGSGSLSRGVRHERGRRLRRRGSALRFLEDTRDRCSGWQLGRRSSGNTGADWRHGSGKLAEHDGGGGRDVVRGSARLAHDGECAHIGAREFGLRQGDQSPLDDPDGAHHDFYASC